MLFLKFDKYKFYIYYYAIKLVDGVFLNESN